MKKIVLKTALITLLSLVCVLFFGVFGVYAFAPKLSAKVCFDLGLNGLSSSCYERVYKKTGELDDLIVVIDSAVYAEKQETVEKYGLTLFETYGKTSEFESFCKLSDEDLEDDSYTTYDYYANTVFFSLYDQDKKEEAAKFAFNYIGRVGYTEKCVLKTAVKLSSEDLELGILLIDYYKVGKFSISFFVTDMKNLGYKF